MKRFLMIVCFVFVFAFASTAYAKASLQPWPGDIPDINPPVIRKITTYVVKRGDCLIRIARKYKISWIDIYGENKKALKKNPRLIKIGQKLKIIYYIF